jgi:hypothetical protein
VVQGEIPAATRLQETPARGQQMISMQGMYPNPDDAALVVLYCKNEKLSQTKKLLMTS